MSIEGMIGGAIGPKEGERLEAAQEKREELDRAYAEGRADQFADDKARMDELLCALQAMVRTWEAYLSSPSGYPAFNRAKAVIAKAAGEQS